jgi:hypothetical protein
MPCSCDFLGISPCRHVAARQAATSPCKYLGEPLPLLQIRKLGLDALKGWTGCDHPAEPLGPVVCPCNRCGPNCPGYAAEPPEDQPRPVSAAAPPNATTFTVTT